MNCYWDGSKSVYIKKPVSYTHLDVYKRQVFDCAEGTLYVEFCSDCQIVSMQHQQT